MVKLIASDLDGTLLQNGAHDVNPIVFDQIRTLKEHGIMFAAASGRQYLNLRRLFTPVQDDIAYIAENGSLCIYNEETISKGIIELDLAYRILDEVAKYPQYNCIICPTANKGSALKDLIDHLHIAAKDCVVFGDQYNDVEMLQTAGTSYAMANAAPGIDKYATNVTDSVEKNLQQIIDELAAV